MAPASPTVEGFRAAFRRPAITFAEIAWRWTVGSVACALVLFSVIEFVDSVSVTRGDSALLGTRQPLLVGRAISHILRGTLNRVVLAALFAGLALVVLWIFAAAIGRVATVRAILDCFRRNSAGDVSVEQSLPLPFTSLLALNCLRVVVALASILAFTGAAILAGFASPDANPRPGLAFVLFLPLGAAICMVWPVLNWILSLASIFVIRDGQDALTALSTGVAFSRERAGAVSAVSTWTGLAHLVAFSVACSAASLPLVFLQVVPAQLVVAAIVVLALAYFAVVDWLYIARFAGYIAIAEMPAVVRAAVAWPAPSPQTAIDRDEPILSDLPNLVVET